MTDNKKPQATENSLKSKKVYIPIKIRKDGKKEDYGDFKRKDGGLGKS